MLSSEKYCGIISILHLAGRLWLWASTTQVRVDMLFDDAWCICTQGGENTSQFHKFQYRLIHLHTLRSFVWDFCVSEALTRGWKVLWMMHGTCTPCWGSGWNDNFDTLKIRLRPCFEFSIGKRTTFHWSRSCSLEGSLCHWMMTESDSWLTATRATRCRLHRWDESSMNSMFIAMQYCANTFYILLIWFLQDFCVQVPSRDNILMNLQWSNAQWESTSSTWSKRTAFLDGNFCEAMGPKLGRINTLWTQGAQPQALPTPCSCSSSCSSVTLWMSWRKNFPLMSIEPQSHLVNLSQTHVRLELFFFGNENL